MALSETTDLTFAKDVLESPIPVLVDFWAQWCGPCRMIIPILEELAPEVSDKVKIVKLNIDDNSDTPAKYAVRSIPTLIMFKDGKVLDQKTGVLTKVALKQWIDSNLD